MLNCQFVIISEDLFFHNPSRIPSIIFIYSPSPFLYIKIKLYTPLIYLSSCQGPDTISRIYDQLNVCYLLLLKCCNFIQVSRNITKQCTPQYTPIFYDEKRENDGNWNLTKIWSKKRKK